MDIKVGDYVTVIDGSSIKDPHGLEFSPAHSRLIGNRIRVTEVDENSIRARSIYWSKLWVKDPGGLKYARAIPTIPEKDFPEIILDIKKNRFGNPGFGNPKNDLPSSVDGVEVW